MKKYTLDGEPVDIEEFIATNTAPDVEPLPEDEIAAIRDLKPGVELTLGGGASAVFIIYCNDLKSIAEEAQLAFWAKVVELLPECTTGDFSPEDTFAFDGACEQAVEAWYGWNGPEEDETSA